MGPRGAMAPSLLSHFSKVSMSWLTFAIASILCRGPLTCFLLATPLFDVIWLHATTIYNYNTYANNILLDSDGYCIQSVGAHCLYTESLNWIITSAYYSLLTHLRISRDVSDYAYLCANAIKWRVSVTRHDWYFRSCDRWISQTMD